jgi:putative Ca2+/H+ antiporter (TMEM165/GDT1 family)
VLRNAERDYRSMTAGKAATRCANLQCAAACCAASPRNMTAFLISIGVVALAEIGDKTQLLALALAAKYRKPWPIIFGILVATMANHFLAGAVGTWLTRTIGPEPMRWALGLSFIAMALWMLIPDKLDDESEKTSRFGVFGTTLIAFFIVEMGDKTQIATVALAARYDALVAVVAGTTIGMMIANVPAVLLGNVAAEKLPKRVMNGLAAVVFALIGIAVLWGVDIGL